MTEQEAKSFNNIGFEEKDCYKAEIALEKYEEISYSFVNHFDNMISEGKRYFAKNKPYVLIHDFNQYSHSKRSGHYGNPDYFGTAKKCVASDLHWVGLNPYEQVMLAFKWNFRGIFWYPYGKVFFIHLDWKFWDRLPRQIVFGYRTGDGKMVTCNSDFQAVINNLNLLKKWSPAWNSRK